MAAQVVTVTESFDPADEWVQKIKWDWLSAADGTVTSQTTNAYTGPIVRVEIVPDSGDTAPTTLYDMTITNEDGVDVLAGNGANLSATATSYFDIGYSLGVLVNSKLTLNITNAGDANGGLVIVYVYMGE